MTSGVSSWKYRLQKATRLSFWLPSNYVVGARNGFLRDHHLGLFRLASKLFHVGANVDGLAYRLHRPTNCG
jgi:hypothetical protein